MLIELFLTVVNMSLGAVPIMLAVLLLRLLFKKSVPRKVFYIAWILVFIRLMVPVSFESDFSFFGFLPENYIEESTVGTSIEFVKDEGTTLDFPVLQHPSEDNPDVDFLPTETEIPEFVAPPPQVNTPTVTRSPIENNLVFATAWVFGTAALLAFGILGYIMVLRKIKAESVPYANNIILCDFFQTPMVCGFIKPKIILPLTFDFDDEAKVKSVLSHENTHIKRFDNLRRLLASFTLYVHWFNPLVWVCYWAFIRDMEVSCDEEVLQKSTGDIRSDYAESLVSLAGAGINPLYGGVLSFGETAIKERVKCIMNFKKAKLFIIIICVAVAAALGVIFLTNPAAPNGENSFERYYNSVFFPDENESNLKIISTIENISEKAIYVSPEHGIYKLSGEEKIPAMDYIGEGSTVVIPAGDDYRFTVELGEYAFEGTDVYGEIEIIRKVYADAECTKLLGEAQWIYNITTDFKGYIATDYVYIPIETTPKKPEDLATERDLSEFKETINSLDVSNIAEFIAMKPLNVGDFRTSIDQGVAEQFIRLIKEVEPYAPQEAIEPITESTVIMLYFRTVDGEFCLSYDGRIVLHKAGSVKGTVFGVGNEKPFEEMVNSFEKIILDPPKYGDFEQHYPFNGKIVYAEKFEGDVMKLPNKTGYSFTDINMSHVEMKEYMSKITVQNLSELYVYRTPYEGRISIDLGIEDAAKILHYLSVMTPTHPERTNKPFSDEGTHVCVKSTDGMAYYVRLADDGYFTFYTPGIDMMVVSGGDDCKLAFDAVNALVDGIINENAVNPPVPAESENPANIIGLCNPGDSDLLPIKYSVNSKRLGTAEDSRQAKLAIESVTSENIKSIYIVDATGTGKKDIPISKTGAMAIVNALRAVKFEVYDIPEMPNPVMTGGNIFYIETAEDTFMVDSSGGMITFRRKGDKEGAVFNDMNEHQTFAKISEIISEVTGQSQGTSNVSANFSSEGVKLPTFDDLNIVTLFNNSVRLCAAPEAIIDISAAGISRSFWEAIYHTAEFIPGTTDARLGNIANIVDMIEFTEYDGTKYTVKLFSHGFTLSGSAVSEEFVGSWIIKEEHWSKFLSTAKEFYIDADKKYASWLGLISAKRITKAVVTDSSRNAKMEYDPNNDYASVMMMVSWLKDVEVSQNPERVPKAEVKFTGKFVKFELDFVNGNKYTVLLSEDKLGIIADDMQNALVYNIVNNGINYYENLTQFANENYEMNVTTG